MSMTVRSKKEKGTRLEKMFADMLVEAGLDQYAKRMVMSGAVKGFDGDVLTKLPLHIECKNQETWQPMVYYKQASLSNPAPARKMNLVILKRNHTDIFAFLKADDLVELMNYALEGGWGK